jgi:hypothetical protein
MQTESVDDNSPIWGAAAIGRVINRSARATFHLLEGGHLPATKISGRWVSTPAALKKDIAKQIAAEAK